MIHVKKLRGMMVEQDVSVQELANKCGVHESTLYRWFECPDSITCKNALRIRNALHMSDDTFMNVFFASDVA